GDHARSLQRDRQARAAQAAGCGRLVSKANRRTSHRVCGPTRSNLLCASALSLLSQCRDLRESVLQVCVQLAIYVVMPLVARGSFLIGTSLLSFINRTVASLLDRAECAGSDAGEDGDAVGGTFGGVGHDDRAVVDVGLELPPECRARAAAAGAHLSDGDVH